MNINSDDYRYNQMSPMRKFENIGFIYAWIFGLIFYFLEYVIRSSPAVMISELSDIYHVDSLRVSNILGTYYYTYSVSSLIAGVALDRAGAKYSVSVGAGILCIGCMLFVLPKPMWGDIGRLFQGAGSAFAFTGCVYLASHGFSARFIATAIGLTQFIGMLGGSVGQFGAWPLIKTGLSAHTFWIGIGVACGIVSLLLYIRTPREDKTAEHNTAIKSVLVPYKIVFSNVQSYLNGIISGLLFAPTTIFAMTWGVSFFQHDRKFSFDSAVLVCSMVPLGWVIGSPLMGWLSDFIGKRKPLLTVGISLMFLSFFQLIYMPNLISPVVTMLFFGIASGATMLPYSMIKEANPDNVKGSAIGAISFITFGVSAFLGTLFGSLYGKTLLLAANPLNHFRSAGNFLLITIIMALPISLIAEETGSDKKKLNLVG